MYACVYVCMCVYECMCICIYVCVCMYVYVCMYVCMCVCMYVRTYVRTYVCMYECMYTINFYPISKTFVAWGIGYKQWSMHTDPTHVIEWLVVVGHLDSASARYYSGTLGFSLLCTQTWFSNTHVRTTYIINDLFLLTLVVGSILHGVDPLSYFSFQPVLHN